MYALPDLGGGGGGGSCPVDVSDYVVSFPDPNNPSEDRLPVYCKRPSLGLFGSGNETSF